MPSIVSDEFIGFFDPQEKIWDKESGRRFPIQELSNSDHLKVFNGIEDINFNMTDTHYPHTIFRFPLRRKPSELSENVYTVKKVNKLIEALRSEAKLLLLFLRYVHTVEVYNIDEDGIITLSFQTKVANAEKLHRQRMSFIHSVKQAHGSHPSSCSKKISSFSKFDVRVKKKSTEEPVTNTWLVVNMVDSTNSEVRDKSIEVDVFPWVGTAVELDNPQNGRLFCFLPIPTDAVSNLPVHVNAMFGVSDDRRSIKWPGSERQYDRMAYWNQMLVGDVIPSCYVQLLLEAKVHLGKNFYQAWPNIESIEGTEWERLLIPVFRMLLKEEVILTSCDSWVVPTVPCYISWSYTLLKVVETALGCLGVTLAQVPDSVRVVFEFSKLQITELSPSFLRAKLQACPDKFYNQWSSKEKHDLLRYCLSDNQNNSYKELAGIHLLPLANETFLAFETLLSDTNHVFLCSHEYPRKLLPKIDHRLIDMHKTDPDLQAKLMLVAGSHKTQLRVLDVHSVAKLLSEIMPSMWRNEKSVRFSDEDFQFSWFEVFWKWVKDKDLSLFEDKLVFPIETTDPNTQEHSVAILSRDKPILYIPFLVNAPDYMLSAIGKLGIQYCSQAKFLFVDHRKITNYVKIYNHNGVAVLEALTQKGDCTSIDFSPKEAECLRNAFAQIQLSQKNCDVLQGLKIFSTCVNTSYRLHSPSEVAQLSKNVVVEPSNTINLSSLPSDIIIFSSENSYQTQLLKKLGFAKSSGVGFISTLILPKICSMKDHYIDGIMTQVLDLYQSLCTSSKDITAIIQHLPFVKTDSGDRKCPIELFDPSNKFIQVIYLGENNKFPDEPYNSDKYISVLKQCGLRSALNPQEVLDVISSIGLPATEVPEPVGMTEWSRAVGIIEYITSNDFCSTSSEEKDPTVSFQENLKLYSGVKNWIPVLADRPSNYPTCLSWKGDDHSSHFISLKGSVCVSSTNSPTLPLLYGSQVFFTHMFNDETLKWDEPVHCLFPHFEQVMKACKDFAPEEMMSILDNLYFAMQELVDSTSSHHVDQLRSIGDWVYIKKHHRFVSIDNVAVECNPTFDHNVEPFVYIIPDSISKYTKLFKFCGMKENISESQIISILGFVKQGKVHSTVSEADKLRIVVAILNWLTDNGTKPYDKSKYSEPVYVPVQSLSDELDLRELSEVVYADNEFLKNTLESEGLIYVHDRISHLASSLHVVPLSEKLDISEDTFEDAGHSEPLTVRLKTILNDYKDGLPIIKELIQNADDAEATEVNICYDKRSHAINEDMLFFAGMSKSHGPALIVNNNSMFSDEDFVNIQKLAAGTKRNNKLKIGKFGTGFCSVYHITDVPSFLSRDRLYIFDPTLKHLKEAVKNEARPGKKVNFRAKFFSQSKQLEPYEGLFGFDSKSEYNGTMFRLPFRTSESELSSIPYTDTDVRKLIDGIEECGDNLLLFLRHVKRISVYQFDADKSSPEIVYQLHKPAIQHSFHSSDATIVVTETEKFGRDNSKRSWLVANYEHAQEEKIALATVACLLEGSDQSYSVSANMDGEVFCFLPLSQSIGLPIHVSCNFALINSRQGLWTSNKDAAAGGPMEAQWNTTLMKNAIPVACMRLFNGLKSMQENDILQNYKFYHLWPLISNLKQHNPWSQFVFQLYKELSTSKHSTSKLFFSEAKKEWNSIKDSKFLEPKILGTTETPECVLEVLKHLNVVVVDLPVKYRELLQLNDSLLTKSSFINMFFSHLPSLTDICSSRNEVIQLILEMYASDCDSDTEICKILKGKLETTACIPCSPDGVKLKNVNELIHPIAPFAELYDPAESMVPSDDLVKKKFVEVSLKNLGIIYNVMPWGYVIERAQTIQKLLETDSKKAYTRIKLIIETVASYTEGPDIDSIKFLPILKKPEGFPLPWAGSEVVLGSGRELLRSNPLHINVTGSKSLFLDEAKLQEGGECHINKRTEEILGLKSVPSICDVVSHFDLLIKSVTEAIISIPLDWTDTSCEHIYEFLDEVLDEKDSESLEQLKQLQCVWTGSSFIGTDQVSFKWSLNGPYLYRVPDILSSRKSLCSILGIKETFSSADIRKAMLKMKEDYKDQPVEKPSQEIIQHTQTLLDDLENDGSSFILPDENFTLHNAEDLAYNDAPWASEEESYTYVHEIIPRELAKKLGVKPVLSKFLEKFASVYGFKKQNEGKSFGQHEELTQRIQNILHDYLLDVTLLKELIQNADDAKASKVYFILDKRFHSTDRTLPDNWEDLQGPALLVWNDSVFSEKDLDGIQDLGLGSKRSEADSIGQFGIGFNVVYQITDCPSFVTGGETLCIMDPHCRYVPGANKLSPGRRFDKIGEGFWNRFPGMKSPYMRGDSVDNLPPEILNGSLFRFPLRHTQRKIKHSEIIETDINPEELGDNLCAWMAEIKQTMFFLNNVAELKLLVIGDKSAELKTVFHYKTRIEDSAMSDKGVFQGKLTTFKDGGSCNPCTIMYPLHFTKVSNSGEEMNEKWLVQQSVGDINNSNQRWQYVDLMKPRHGLATPLSTAGEFEGQVFSFLPLPIKSGLPIHVNGRFILDSARRDLWLHSYKDSVDDPSRWNTNLIHALSSSYAEFLFQARDHYVSREYDNVGTALSDIERYYSLFPLVNHCRDQWQAMAYNLYKFLVEKNHKIFCGLKTKPDGKGYTIVWYNLRSSKPAECVYYWNPSQYIDNHKDIYPILERIGMQITPISSHIIGCFNAAFKEFKLQTLLSVSRETIFKYYTKFSSFSDPLSPAAVNTTAFQNEKSFVLFTRYLLKDFSSQSSRMAIGMYPSSPFDSYLLLTADGFLRNFDEKVKVFMSSFSHLFPNSLESFLHPELLEVNYSNSYFLQPGGSDEDKKCISNFILCILGKNFPKELKSATMIPYSSIVITEDQLQKLWNCFSEDEVFKNFIEQVLKKWAFLLTTDNRLFSTSSSILPVETNSDSQMCQVMKKLKMPFLNTRVVVAETKCPKLKEKARVLSNLYHINLENPIHTSLDNKDLIAIIEYLSSVQQFNSDHVKSLPFFETIDGKFTHVSNRKAYVWPLDCCPVAYQSWLDGHDAVFIKQHAKWSQLGSAKDLSIHEICTEDIYAKFIFCHFHKLNSKKRYQHLEFLRNNMFDRITASSQILLDADSPQEIIDQKKQAASFIDGLKKLECMGDDSSNPLSTISALCDHTVDIFKKFRSHFLFLPDQYQKDTKWLPFLRDLGLQQTVSEEDYIKLCQETAEKAEHVKDYPDIEKCSSVLLKYLFEKKEIWTDSTYRRVSEIEFVFQEKFPELTWAVAGICPDKLMVKLDGSAPLERANLLWTVKSMVKIPVKIEELQDIASPLGINVVPTVVAVIENIGNICSNSKFAQQALFTKSIYPRELTCSKRQENLMKIMCDNFTYLQNCDLSSSNYDDLKSLPCIPVYHTIISRHKTPDKVVFVKPNSVICDRWDSSVEDFHPFLHCLPEELQTVVQLLIDIDITDKLELRHFQMILEDVFTRFDGTDLDQCTSECVQHTIQKLYDFFSHHSGDHERDITPLYLPDIENKMRLSEELLYEDISDVKLDLKGTKYFHFSISDFTFSVIELCKALPDSVRPISLLSVCDEVVVDGFSQSDDSSLASQLKKTINFTELHEGICLLIFRKFSKKVNEDDLKQLIKSCLGKFEIITVTDLSTKIILKDSKKTIGERKVSFFIASVEDTSILYLEKLEEYEMLTDIHLQIANHFSKEICLKIDEDIAEEKRGQLSEAILKCLGKTSSDSIKKTFKNDYGIQVKGDEMPSLSGEAGEELPEDWHHRLDQDISISYKPRDYVGYEDREGHFIVARVAYQLKPQDEIELNRKYRIYTSVAKKCFKDVDVLSLYKFIKPSPTKEEPSEDMTLSGKIKIRDQFKMFWRISSDIRDSLIQKGIKRLFLRWHPEKNVHCVFHYSITACGKTPGPRRSNQEEKFH